MGLQPSEEVFPHAGKKGNWADEMDLLDLPPETIFTSSSDHELSKSNKESVDYVPEEKLHTVEMGTSTPGSTLADESKLDDLNLSGMTPTIASWCALQPDGNSVVVDKKLLCRLFLNVLEVGASTLLQIMVDDLDHCH